MDHDMNRETVLQAVAEADRFIARVRELLDQQVPTYRGPNDYPEVPWQAHGAPAQQGAVRRASLDLTRSLARMRKAP